MTRQIVGMLLAATALSSTVYAAEVDRREARQQARIAEGIENGQLTPRETGRLENREARIQNQIATERAANGGKLTRAERAQVNREQNRVSRSIYRQKHDAQHR